jgi:hypothetical protein
VTDADPREVRTRPVEEPVRKRFTTRRRAAAVTEPARSETPVGDETPTTDYRAGREDQAVRDREAEDTTVEKAPRHFRTSMFATLGLVVGLAALAATFTGLLAPVGVVLGVAGAAIAAGGLVGASRRGVTGHSVALLGLACGVFAIVLGVLAMGHQISWLDSRTDEVARFRDWLDTQMPWLKNR